MKPYCLASSSAGNCYIFEFEGVPPLMVECGIPYSKIIQGCNKQFINLSKVKNCLITHAHTDHCLAARELNLRGINIYASQPTLDKLKIKGRTLELLKPNKITDGLFVLPFEVDHDCNGSIGFVIKTQKECVIFVNDHKLWKVNLSKFKPDYVFIECNYDHKMVYAQYHQLKRLRDSGNIPQSELMEINTKIAQHERNINSHCSLAGTIRGLEKLDLSQCKSIILMHLSDRYANEYKMKNEIMRRFAIQTLVCGKGGSIK